MSFVFVLMVVLVMVVCVYVSVQVHVYMRDQNRALSVPLFVLLLMSKTDDFSEMDP